MTHDVYSRLGTQRISDVLRRGRGDPNDVRLGETLGDTPADFDAAHVVIIGCPQDEGVVRNHGRPGAARGPGEIRRALYRLTINGLDALRLFDAGDVLPQSELEETHERQRAAMRALLAAGKRVVALGGGNDLSFPDCAALADVAAPVLAFNVDAHFDVRADTPRNSGTPYRELLEGGHVEPQRLHQIGHQTHANSPVYAAWLEERGVTMLALEELRRRGMGTCITELLQADPEARSVFFGLDMDVVSAAEAPGVSAPNACGMTARELCEVASIAGRDPRTRVLEITEVNPAYDVDARTSRLAAVAIHSYLMEAAAAVRLEEAT